MEIKDEFRKEIEILKRKFSKKEEIDFIDSIEDSIYIYCFLKGEDKKILFKEYEKNWIKRCAIELLSRDGKVNIQSYSENGFSLSYFTGIISEELKNEIIPYAKSLRRATENDTN